MYLKKLFPTYSYGDKHPLTEKVQFCRQLNSDFRRGNATLQQPNYKCLRKITFNWPRNLFNIYYELVLYLIKALRFLSFFGLVVKALDFHVGGPSSILSKFGLFQSKINYLNTVGNFQFSNLTYMLNFNICSFRVFLTSNMINFIIIIAQYNMLFFQCNCNDVYLYVELIQAFIDTNMVQIENV